MRILYHSVHEILEYDDLRMFTAAGHQVLSIGCFGTPRPDPSTFRPARPEFYDAELLAPRDRHGFTPDLLANFDVAIVNHDSGWLAQNLEILRPAKIVYRTLGQSTIAHEHIAAQLGDAISIVRYSEREIGLDGFGKTDAVIPFGKDLEDFAEHWEGGQSAATFHNDFAARHEHSVPNPDEYRQIISGAASTLYSRGNDGFPNWGGMKTFGEMQEIYRTCAAYVYVWSACASYTLNLMEAIMTGAPVIAPSTKFIESNPRSFPGMHWQAARYEVEDLLRDDNSLVYDDTKQAATFLRRAVDDPSSVKAMAARVGARSRERFDMRRVGKLWTDFIRSI